MHNKTYRYCFTKFSVTGISANWHLRPYVFLRCVLVSKSIKIWKCGRVVSMTFPGQFFCWHLILKQCSWNKTASCSAWIPLVLIILIFTSKYATSIGINNDTHSGFEHLNDLVALGSVGLEQQKRFFHIAVIESSAINLCGLIDGASGSFTSG